MLQCTAIGYSSTDIGDRRQSVRLLKRAAAPIAALLLCTISLYSLALVLIRFDALQFVSGQHPSPLLCSLKVEREERRTARQAHRTTTSTNATLPSVLSEFLTLVYPIPVIVIDRRLSECLLHSDHSCSSLTNGNRFEFLLDQRYRECVLMMKVNETNWQRLITDGSVQLFHSLTNTCFDVHFYDVRPNYLYVKRDSHNTTRAVNRFTTRTMSLVQHESVAVQIPSDVESFLRQWSKSTFLQCRHSLRDSLRSEFPQHYKRVNFYKNATSAMVDFRDLLYNLNVTAMLCGGTLLGWYRECGFIPYTTDVDFFAPISDYSSQIDRRLMWDSGFSLHWILGKPSDSLEYTVYRHRVKMDLFFLYEQSNVTWVGGMMPRTRKKLRWVYPKLDGICTGDLHGHLFLVPCNAVAFLEADYGPQWYRPHHQKNFTWHQSHFNVEVTGKWSQKEFRSVYRTRFH